MFSVIIPAYNAEQFIARSINFVLKQTYQAFELIVVNDGSQDGTEQIVKQFDDKRIHYIYQENAGVSVARNTGILASTGKYICFLDADDEWKDDHLEELSSLIEEYKSCGFYVTGYDILLNNGEIIPKSRRILKGIKEEHFFSDNGYDVLLKNGYFFNTNTVCCCRDVFEKVGFFEAGVKNAEDDDMWMRIFAFYSIAVSKKVTTVYNRTNCIATSNRVVVLDNVFLGRLDGLLRSTEVPKNRKDSLLLWYEQNKLSRCRQCILIGNKWSALKLLWAIDFKKVKKKKYLETIMCMLIPSKLIKKYIDKRDVGYYQ